MLRSATLTWLTASLLACASSGPPAPATEQPPSAPPPATASPTAAGAAATTLATASAAPPDPPGQALRYVDHPLDGEPAAERFDQAPEAGDGRRPCTVRQVGKWVRVRCPRRALLDLFDSSRGGHRVVVSEQDLTHVFVERPGRTTTLYLFDDDGAYELGLDTGDGKRAWFKSGKLAPRGREHLLRAHACCLEVRAPRAPAGAAACFGSDMWSSPRGEDCYRSAKTCGELDECLIAAFYR